MRGVSTAISWYRSIVLVKTSRMHMRSRMRGVVVAVISYAKHCRCRGVVHYDADESEASNFAQIRRQDETITYEICMLIARHQTSRRPSKA
jgi:hypothetical protein